MDNMVEVNNQFYIAVEGELHHVPQDKDGLLSTQESYPVDDCVVGTDQMREHDEARAKLDIL